jgi:hypothetical protein
MMRWQNGVGWEEVSGFDIPTPSYENSDFPTLVFKNVGGTLYYGYDHTGTDLGKMMVWKYTSNATLTSCWVDTGFPSEPTTSGFARIYSFDATQGASGATYVPTLDGDNYILNEMHYGGGGGTSTCVITHAVPGDIYNIGGVSNEPTTHIEFTMWDNSAYGSKGKGK